MAQKCFIIHIWIMAMKVKPYELLYKKCVKVTRYKSSYRDGRNLGQVIVKSGFLKNFIGSIVIVKIYRAMPKHYVRGKKYAVG